MASVCFEVHGDFITELARERYNETKDDGFLIDIFGASPVFDVKVQDRRGNELIIPNAKISERLRVTHRIPRKLKKTLKKKHGVYWVQHHPNTETVVTINSQN